MFPSVIARYLRFELRLFFAFALVVNLADALRSQEVGSFVDLPSPPSNQVFSYELRDGFGSEQYHTAVEDLLSRFEKEREIVYQPDEKKRVGIKVYSDSGAGLSTPEDLVEAVVKALERRGYERKNVFIIGLSSYSLRDAGFLPPLSRRSVYFNQVFVRSLDTGAFYNQGWFYDSPLPAQTSDSWIDIEVENATITPQDSKTERRSLLPMPLMHEVDFWINMPCYSDHPTLGVNGALMNATLWNASNTMRFLNNPASASVAVAEMGAIPELRETWALNIVSLERYQYVGGPIFNSLYTVTEPLVLLSDNPVMLDALMKDKMDQHRLKNGFAPLPEELKILAYSEQLGLGESDTSRMSLIKVH